VVACRVSAVYWCTSLPFCIPRFLSEDFTKCFVVISLAHDWIVRGTFCFKLYSVLSASSHTMTSVSSSRQIKFIHSFKLLHTDCCYASCFISRYSCHGHFVFFKNFFSVALCSSEFSCSVVRELDINSCIAFNLKFFCKMLKSVCLRTKRAWVNLRLQTQIDFTASFLLLWFADLVFFVLKCSSKLQPMPLQTQYVCLCLTLNTYLRFYKYELFQPPGYCYASYWR